MPQTDALLERAGLELSNARLDSLSKLGLPLAGRRVLCLGADAAVVSYFLDQGCSVTCEDVSPDLLCALNERFPAIETRVVSLQGKDIDISGTFDIGYCGGLHNAYSPAAVLKSLSGVCGFCVVVDGWIADDLEATTRVVDDEFGHRYCISPAQIIETFRGSSYPFFYTPLPRPEHDDYKFTYLSDGGSARDGHPLRLMIVASRAKLEGPHLQEIGGSEQLARADSLERWPLAILRLMVNRKYQPQPLRARPEWFVGSNTDPTPEQVMMDRLWRALRLKTSNQGEVVIPWYQGIKLHLTLDDEIARCVFVEGTFEPTGFWLMDRLLKDGMTFLDAGANFGVFTVFASRKVGRDGLVLAFEPSRRELDKLRNNVERNRMSNVRLFRDALGAESGTAQLLVARMPYAGHNTLGSFAYDSTGLERVEEVPMRTLDEVISSEGVKRLNVIKMDVEGAELSVLKGGLTTLRKHRPIILMELSDRTLEGQGSLSSEILSFLHASAYKVFEYTKSGLQEALPDRTYDGNNVIAIPLESVAQTAAALS